MRLGPPPPELALALALLSVGCDTHSPESEQAPAADIVGSAVNTSDSYVRGTLTVDFDATVISDTPMYDAVTGQTTTQITLDTPPSRFDFEAGYDTQGRFVYDQVALDPMDDPLTQSVDEVRHVRVRGGTFQLLDAQGVPVTGGIPPPSLTTVFGTTKSDPLVILDGIVVTSFPQVGSSTSRSGSTSQVTNVTTAGATTTVHSTVSSPDPTIPDLPQKRVYVQSGSQHVLSEVQTNISTTTSGTRVTGTATIRLANLTWNRSTSKDNARRVGTSNPWATSSGFGQEAIPPPDCDPHQPPPPNGPDGPECADDPSPPPPGGGSQECPPVTGGANLVYVHGILSSGEKWGNPNYGTSSGGGVAGPIRCALQVDIESAPSLTQGGDDGTGRHTEQASQLQTHVQGKSNVIFVAHSQGGLISRRVAQGTWGSQAGRVRAVVTTGTPHAGAPIAKSLNPGPGTNRFINSFTGFVTGRFSPCQFAPCNPVESSFKGLRDSYIAGAFPSSAMSDLKPGSAAITSVNAADETFPRYGIQHAIPRRWAIAQVAGDYLPNNSGTYVRSVVRDTYTVTVAAAVIGGVVSILVPWAAVVAARAAFHAAAMDSTDRWWTRITVGNDEGDGIVPYASQVYPRAIRNYRAIYPVSHTAEIDTRTSSRSIETILRENAQVPIR